MALALLAFDPGERAVDVRRVETVVRHAVDGGHHPGFDFPGEVRIAPVETAAESQPRTRRLHGTRRECHRRAAGRLQQRAVKRAVPIRQQTRREKLRADRLDGVRGLPETPPERDAGAGRFAIPGTVRRVVNHRSSRRPERRKPRRPGTRTGFGPPA